MSPPSGAVPSLHLRPNTWLSSPSELRLPEFMWVPLLWQITSSLPPPPPTLLCVFTCLLELSAQTLTCSLCCSGRWPRPAATVDGDWRGKDLGECALSEGCSPFLCICPPSHNSRLWGFLSEASLLPVMTKDWATMLLHCACTQNASRCAQKAVKAVYLFFCWATNVFKVHLCFISRGILGWHRGEMAVILRMLSVNSLWLWN